MAARAPYNFIPFPNKPLVRYESAAEIPGHDSTDPELLSGEIQVTVEAETPILVSDGITEFVRNPDGKVVIPGSTMKGLTRANMQILGFGRMNPETDLDDRHDRQIFFRTVGDTAEDSRNQYYKAVVPVHQIPVGDGKTVTVPESMKAGYLHHDGRNYYIKPAATVSTSDGRNYIPLPLDHEDVLRLAPGFAKCVHINYDGIGYKMRLYAFSNDSTLPEGWLLKTGRYIGDPNKCYVFPKEDCKAGRIELKNEDVLSYKADYEAKRNSLGNFGFTKEEAKTADWYAKKQAMNYWDLPASGKTKPMFYASYEGHVYLGISLFPRIAYQNLFTKGIPMEHHKQSFGLAIDYPTAVLGFANKDNAYKSRVSFEDFKLGDEFDNKQNLTAENIVSGEPRPSYYRGYVNDGKHYNEEDFQLRGYKRYWLKPPAPKSGKPNVNNSVTLINKGSLFRGTLHFKNLHKDELGLLLWSVAGEEDSRMNLGRGKPYGYGRVNITIDKLRLLSSDKSYSLSTFAAAPVYTEGDTAAYIESYISKAESMLSQDEDKPPLRSYDQIKDFFYMYSRIMPGNLTSYMELSEYSSANKNNETLPTVADYCRQDIGTRIEAEIKPDDTGDNWADLLGSKFKKL